MLGPRILYLQIKQQSGMELKEIKELLSIKQLKRLLFFVGEDDLGFQFN
jgi:hypothetical protein